MTLDLLWAEGFYLLSLVGLLEQDLERKKQWVSEKHVPNIHLFAGEMSA